MQHNSYQRVATSLNHQEPDRIPFDLAGSYVTGINIHALRKVRRHFGLTGEPRLLDRITQIAALGEEVEKLLRVDVCSVKPQPPINPGAAGELGRQGTHYRLIDEFGMGWQMPVEGGHYYDLYHSPLAYAQTIQDVEKYPWPDPLDPGRFVGMKERAEQIVAVSKKGLLVERMHSGMWEHAMWMTGYEKFYIDMATNEKLVHALMNKELEIKMKYWGQVLDILDHHTLVISEADDLGAQDGLLVSLDMYKRLIWPYHKKLFEFIKSKAKTKVFIFFHNDGAIYETIPLLIEAGVDILNPWQVNCRGMDDTKKFKREWGDLLTIWGGSCDTQRTLPFGTPQQVRDETRRRIEDLAPGGGFIFAPIHVIQAGVPIENFIAWWETLQEYGGY